MKSIPRVSACAWFTRTPESVSAVIGRGQKSMNGTTFLRKSGHAFSTNFRAGKNCFAATGGGGGPVAADAPGRGARAAGARRNRRTFREYSGKPPNREV